MKRPGSSSMLAAAAATLAIVLAGCVAHERIGAQPGPGPAASGPRPFDYRRAPVEFSNAVREELSSNVHRVRHLHLDSVGDNGHPERELEVLFFESRDPGPHPLVVVLPIWGKYEFPPRTVVRKLLRRNGGSIHVMWVTGRHYLFDWPRMAAAETPEAFEALAFEMADRAETMVIDLRRLLDWTEQNGVAVSKAGLVGFSISAVVGALVLAAEPRYQAGVLMMGGAHPEEIFAICDGRPQMVREQILARFGWPLSTYREVFARAFRSRDPAAYAGHFPKAVMMIDAREDQCMSPASRQAFWNALGRPERLTMNYGHKRAFLGLTQLGFGFLTRQIAAFLEAALLP